MNLVPSLTDVHNRIVLEGAERKLAYIASLVVIIFNSVLEHLVVSLISRCMLIIIIKKFNKY